MTASCTITIVDCVNGSGSCRLGLGRVKDNGGERSEEIHRCVVLGWCSEMLLRGSRKMSGGAVFCLVV